MSKECESCSNLSACLYWSGIPWDRTVASLYISESASKKSLERLNLHCFCVCVCISRLVNAFPICVRVCLIFIFYFLLLCWGPFSFSSSAPSHSAWVLCFSGQPLTQWFVAHTKNRLHSFSLHLLQLSVSPKSFISVAIGWWSCYTAWFWHLYMLLVTL